MVQKLKDNKKSIMIVAGALLACVIAIVVGLSLERAGKISELEKIKLTEVSDDVTAYLEYIEDAGNIDLIKDWILSIEDIYDKSNGEDENDNIGEILYLLSR